MGAPGLSELTLYDRVSLQLALVRGGIKGHQRPGAQDVQKLAVAGWRVDPRLNGVHAVNKHACNLIKLLNLN